VSWKLSRTVLRGVSGGNAARLLDKHIDKIKKPYAFKRRDDAPFAFAGLWDAWKEPGGDWLQSYSLITTEANDLASDVIDRMPVILDPKDYDRWLERDSDRPPLDLLRPFESEQMVKWACNPLVGSVSGVPDLLCRGMS
jgi:putative SOS response-associated peptidase YedK